MQFNSHPTEDDIISAISDATDCNIDEYTLNARTRNCNIAYHKAVSAIQRADGKWQFDDANNTTHPIARTTLTASQRDYQLQDDMIFIDRVEVLDSSGNWHKLTPIDSTRIDCAIEEYQPTAGIPREYDKQGRSLFLYPASDTSITNGLQVYYKRSANIFETTDTTKTPGFDVTWHDYIPTYASLVYCELYKPSRVPVLLARLDKIEKDMVILYSQRSRDEVRRINSKQIAFR